VYDAVVMFYTETQLVFFVLATVIILYHVHLITYHKIISYNRGNFGNARGAGFRVAGDVSAAEEKRAYPRPALDQNASAVFSSS